MKLIDALDGFSPIRLVPCFDPPCNKARPRTTLEPVSALGERFSVDAAIRKRRNGLEIPPQAQRHRELVETKVSRHAGGRQHRAPRMLPRLHVPDRSRKKSGATFSSRIHGRQPVDKSLHHTVANGRFQHTECEERDTSCHALTLARFALGKSAPAIVTSSPIAGRLRVIPGGARPSV